MQRVPALETETPRTSASSALSRPAWNLRAISSRSRGASAGQRGAHGGAALGGLGGVLGRGALGVRRLGGEPALRLRRRSSSSAALRAMPKSQARSRAARGSKERCLRKARSKRAVTSSAAERSRAARRRRRRRRPRGAIERVEARRRVLTPGGGEWEDEGAGHIGTTTWSSIHHGRSGVDVFDGTPRRSSSRLLLAAFACARAAPTTPTCGRPSTCATPPPTRTRSAPRARCPAARRGTRLLMRFRVQYRDLFDRAWRSGARRRLRLAQGREGGGRHACSSPPPDPSRSPARWTRILRGFWLNAIARGSSWPRGHTGNARRVTAGGHRSTGGADPADFSAATCRIDCTSGNVPNSEGVSGRAVPRVVAMRRSRHPGGTP